MEENVYMEMGVGVQKLYRNSFPAQSCLNPNCSKNKGCYLKN